MYFIFILKKRLSNNNNMDEEKNTSNINNDYKNTMNLRYC